MPQAYCSECRASREIRSPQKVTLKNGRGLTQGTCPECGAQIFCMNEKTQFVHHPWDVERYTINSRLANRRLRG